MDATRPLSTRELLDCISQATVDDVARNQLLAIYRPYLKIVAERLVGDVLRRREDASDLVQRSLIEAAEALPRFQGRTEAEFTAWITRLLKRNIADAARTHRRARRDMRREQPAHLDHDSASISWQLPSARTASASTRLIKAEAALNLAQALERLPPDQREAVTLRHLEGRPIAEIAAAMQRTTASVAGLIRRGVDQLRNELSRKI
jgi:RNA polymerase sigma-70 factor (ECF subfamily)